MMATVNICQKILCWQQDVKRLNGCIPKGVHEVVLMQECIDSGQKLLDLIWVGTDQSC